MIICLLETRNVSFQTDKKIIIDNFIDTMQEKYPGRHFTLSPFENRNVEDFLIIKRKNSLKMFIFNKSEFIWMNCYLYLRLISKEYNSHYYFLIYRHDYFSVS